MTAPETIHNLVSRFRDSRELLNSAHYNETQLRIEFLNPLFIELGWDVYNERNIALQYRDVIHEDSLEIEGTTRAPDYAFCVGTSRKFFVEAKKPSARIVTNAEAAYQLRRYAWNAKLPLSILTDFEHFAVYDCRNRPDPKDSAATGRVLLYNFEEYLSHWDEIAKIFSKQAVWSGAFDKFAEGTKGKRGTTEVDAEFLKEIEAWRDLLARNIALRNFRSSEELANLPRAERQLNYAVQATIDRLLFLRISEDREIEPPEQLLQISRQPDIYANLIKLFKHADQKYNSGLFHFSEEKSQTSTPDTFTPTLQIDDKVLRQIIESLYYPCPYIFKEIPVEILGQVYEQFLGKVIRLTPKGIAKVEEKPEVRKAGGVYYTPSYIVDYIVHNTLSTLLHPDQPSSDLSSRGSQFGDRGDLPFQPSSDQGKMPQPLVSPNQTASLTPDQALKLRVVDPACGSGSFLLGAYQYLLDWHLNYYLTHDPESHIRGKNPPIVATEGGDYRLTTEEKKRILTASIYGVDIDAQAVEVTKLSLLLKLLEGETGQLTLGFDRVLPDLGNNICCGNSLIGWDYFASQLLPDEEEIIRVNPFDWQRSFPEVFAQGGFDAVIGNPPYIFTRGGGIASNIKDYCYNKFPNQQYQLNTYSLFIENSWSMLKLSGKLGFIIPNNWLSISTMKSVREFILLNSGNVIIVNNKYKVFSGASVDTSLLMFSKHDPTEVTLLESDEPNKYTYIGAFTPNHLLQEGIISFSTQFQNEHVRHLKTKLSFGTIELGQICTVKSGLKAYETGRGNPPQTNQMKKDRVYHSLKKIDETYRKYLDGKDVQRYKIQWSGQYLKYGPNLAAPRQSQMFSMPRILVRQIPSKPPLSINAMLVTGEEVNDINSMIIFNPDFRYSLHYILGLLNSRLISYWFNITYEKFQRKIFPQFKVNELSKFPIKTINEENTEIVRKIENNVTKMMELNKITSVTPYEEELLQKRILSLDDQIDQLIYKLYGLSNREIDKVENQNII